MVADNVAIACRLGDGTKYFGQLGQIAYDEAEDKVQCHLCGGWFRGFGGSHLRRAHGWTLAQYRVAFQLSTRTPTVAAGVSQVLAANTRRRVAAGELPAPPAPPPSAQQRSEMARRRISPGRSLAALRPDLLRELHPTRNGELDPYALGPSSLQKLWWRCPECEHEWRTSSQSRVGGGYGCPRCAAVRRAAARQGTFTPGRSLADVRPELAGELRDLDPSTLGPGSRTRAQWRCAECGHEWASSVKKRAAGHGCPRCAQQRVAAARRRVATERSLAAIHPELVAQLHPTLNGELDPYSLGVNTRRDVWWKCPDCGHEWRARVRGRAGGSGCPRCARVRVAAALRARAATPSQQGGAPQASGSRTSADASADKGMRERAR
jgi:transposase-like protein